MLCRFDIVVGQRLQFSYPVHNRWGIPLEHRDREIIVTSVRDIRTDPLDAEAVIRNPLRRRGSVLISGVDQELGELRSFWLESMRFDGETIPRPQLQFAFVSLDCPDDSPEPIGPLYSGSLFSARLLAETGKFLESNIARDLPGLRLVITADK